MPIFETSTLRISRPFRDFVQFRYSCIRDIKAILNFCQISNFFELTRERTFLDSSSQNSNKSPFGDDANDENGVQETTLSTVPKTESIRRLMETERMYLRNRMMNFRHVIVT